MAEPRGPGSPTTAVRPVDVVRVSDRGSRPAGDEVAAEEPMEIRVLVNRDGHYERHSIAVTMRTPGHDFELAAGFLFTEGAVDGPADIAEISHCVLTPAEARENVVNVVLPDDRPFDPKRFSRNVYTTSSCGVCGKTSLEMLRLACPDTPRGEVTLASGLIRSLPERLAKAQPGFARTGGLHAAALFDTAGEPMLTREDVGRHNAVDKVVGRLLLDGRLPASDTILLVSGRASFELVQKAVTAGIPVLAAVGAPSSLALELARDYGMTVIGFLRDDRFNVYTGEGRIRV